MIYFVQDLSGGPLKVGFTDNLDRRLEELEKTYDRPLAVLATMPGDRKEERRIHLQFKHLRFGNSEQFRPASDLMAFIGRPLLVGINPDAVEAMPKPERGVQPVRVDLSPEVHHLLRMVAAYEKMSMAAFARLALTQILCREAKARGFKLPPGIAEQFGIAV